MKTSNHQQGFAAVSAVFLIVIIAALGAFMVTFSNTQQLTSAQDLQGSRAYWAARAGLEWGIGSVVASGSTPACPANSGSPLGNTLSTTFDGGFTVNVICYPTDYTEAGVAIHIFQFTSTAHSAGSPGSIGYVERSISASMERCSGTGCTS